MGVGEELEMNFVFKARKRSERLYGAINHKNSPRTKLTINSSFRCK